MGTKCLLPHNEIVRLYRDERLSLREKAPQAGLSRQAVLNILNDNGVTVGRKRRFPKQTEAEIKRLYVDEGKFLKEISGAVGVSKKLVSRVL